MNFEFSDLSSDILDLFLVRSDSFEDFRGVNFEGFDKDVYNKEFSRSDNWKNENPTFVTDSYSRSAKNTLRGFHGDKDTWKLIQCLHGKIFFAVIDKRQGSLTYNKSKTFVLSSENRNQVLVPKGCVNAHLCLSDECLFQYKITQKYVPQENQIHVKWNSPDNDIYWPIKNPITSKRDE